MIPEIDGSSRNHMREFLNANTSMMKNTYPNDETTLLQAILCIKFKGKVIMNFHTCEIINYEQLTRTRKRIFKQQKYHSFAIRVQFIQTKVVGKHAKFRTSSRESPNGIIWVHERGERSLSKTAISYFRKYKGISLI